MSESERDRNQDHEEPESPPAVGGEGDEPGKDGDQHERDAESGVSRVHRSET
jgi:hypothetical protein